MIIIKIVGFLTLITSLFACGGGFNEDLDSSHPTQSAPDHSPVIFDVLDEDNQLLVNWELQRNAQNYTLYISRSNNADEESIEVTEVRTPPYLIEPQNNSEKIRVKIRANWAQKKGPFSNELTLNVPLLAPTNLKTVVTEKNQIIVSWDALESIDNYSIYRKIEDDPDDSRTKLINDASSPYIDETAEPNIEYSYLVVANDSGNISLPSESVTTRLAITTSDPAVTSPKVLAIFPGNNRIDVDPQLNRIDVTFDTDMAGASINIDTFQLKLADGGAISGTVNYTNDGRTASFFPDSALEIGGLYNVTLGTGIKDINGVSLSTRFESYFKTTLPTLEISDFSITEEQANAEFILTLSSPSRSTVNLDFETISGSATSTEDFVSQKSTLTFLPGEVEKSISIAINNDLIFEQDERFAVAFSAIDGVILNKSELNITINDNELIPSLEIQDISVNEGLGSATITASLSHQSKFPISINYTTQGNTAVAGIDFTSTSGTLLFDPLQQSKNLFINLIADDLFEGNEVLSMNFSDPTGTTLNKLSSSITIEDDESLPVLTVNDIITDELNGPITLIASVNTKSVQPISFNFTTLNGSAIEGEDFLASAASVTLPPQALSATFQVNLLDDVIYEDKEQFSIAINGVSGAVFSGNNVIVEINNTTALPQLSVSDIVVLESANEAIVNVTQNIKSTFASQVDFVTADGSATSDTDYQLTSGSLSIAPNTLNSSIRIPLINDQVSEPQKTFSLNLSNPQNALLVNTTATITLDDDEGTPALSINDVSINETATFVTVTASISPPSLSDVQFRFTTQNNTASFNEDYLSTSDIVTIPATRSTIGIQIPIVDDEIYEGNETFWINLTEVSGADLIKGRAIVTIEDSENLPSVVINNASIQEVDNFVTLAASIANPSAFPVTFDFLTSDGSATATLDYTASIGSVIFSPGETTQAFQIPIALDNVFELDEFFNLQLQNPQGATLAQNAVNITIQNSTPPPALIFDSIINTIESGSAEIQLSLSAPSEVAMTVDYFYSDGTATAVGTEDYIPLIGTVIFNPLETSKKLPIPLQNDAIAESSEFFTINFQNANFATLPNPSAQINIGNDDVTDAPQIISITPQEGAVSLQWTPMKTADNYSIYRSTTPNMATDGVVIGEALSSDYVDTLVTNNITYYYAIQSNNNAGPSVLSDVNSARPGFYISSINMPDLALQACITTQGGIFTYEIKALICPGQNISDLTGMDFYTEIEFLDLSNNNITNLFPLTPLTSIFELRLRGNQISDIFPLIGMENLFVVDLSQNLIFDVTPLSDKLNLIELDLSFNQIEFLDRLDTLWGLRILNLAFNGIRDISPLAGLNNLNELHLRQNRILDVFPISFSRELVVLDLSRNEINFGIQSLTSLFFPNFINLSENFLLDCFEVQELDSFFDFGDGPFSGAVYYPDSNCF